MQAIDQLMMVWACHELKIVAFITWSGKKCVPIKIEMIELNEAFIYFYRIFFLH